MAKAKMKSAEQKKPAPKAEMATQRLHRRTMVGVVTSDKMNKTRVVRVERLVQSGMYGKYITKANKFKAHDEENKSKAGDQVVIIESRPLSKDKRWAIQKILRAGSETVLNKV